MAATDVDQDKHAIKRDRWDAEGWNKTRTNITPIPPIEADLQKVAWTGPRLLADLYTSLHKAQPKLSAPEDISPSHRPNRACMEELMGEQAWRDLRQHTVGSPYTAGLAITKMAEELAEMLKRNKDAQEKADDAEAKAAEFVAACQNAGLDPGSNAVLSNAGLRNMLAESEHANQAAADALDAATPGMGKAMRAGAKAAAEAVQEEANIAAGWDLSAGELSAMDPTARMQLAEMLNDERLKKITALLGRFRNMLWAHDSKRWDAGPDEVQDITLSDDLTRLTPMELLNLCVPVLRTDFLDRYTTRKLMTYETRSIKTEGQGGIILVEDNSASMAGDPEIWARAVGLALLDIAIKEGRSFRTIIFGGPGQVFEFEFGGGDITKTTFAERVSYAMFTCHGGTEFEGPLKTAAGYLQAEYDEKSLTTGDIVFLTDGDAGPSMEFFAGGDADDPDWPGWAAKRQELGFRCWGVAISMGVTDTLTRCCDSVAEIHKFTDGSQVSDVFDSIQSKEMAWS